MYKGDLKRLILGYAERIQSTFTMGEAFGAIKEADNRAEVSNAISELYRAGKLSRQKTQLGNSYLYALPAFAPAAFEMNTEQLTEQNEPQKQQEPQEPQKSYVEKKIDEIRTASDQEEAKPAESLKTAEFVPETELQDTKIESEIHRHELRIRYFKSLDEVPDGKEAIDIPAKFKLTLNHPSGMSITIESGAE